MMKNIKKLFILALVVSVFASCEDELAPIQTSGELTKQLKVEELEDKVVESVTGSGHFDRDFQIDVWRTFTLSAQKRESGAIEGTFQINNHGVSEVEGVVLCFTVSENEAIVIAQATAATDPNVVGTLYYARLRDNGQGKANDPDQVTLFHPFTLYEGETIDDYCTFAFDLTFFEVESGNIKVHKSK